MDKEEKIETAKIEEIDKKIEIPKSKKDNSLLIAIIGFILGAIFVIIILKTNMFKNNGNLVITKNETQVYEKNSLAAAVDKIYDAVVLVSAYKGETQLSTGSGFVYKADKNYGYILTNEHVISNANKALLTMSNGKEIEGEILGKDSYLDLAVIRIKREDIIGIANIGKSEKTRLGDTVFTVGSPMGKEYRGTVTSGILSGKDRMVSVPVKNSKNEDWIMKVLQLDASINPGNSGGPLLNINGEVIGIVSLKLVDEKVEGMGFAIPIEYAMSHINSLENKQEIKWPVLGISMANVSDKNTLYRFGLKVPDKLTNGVIVAEVKEGSAAYGQLKVGDIVVKINDKETKDIAHLRYELYQHQAKDEIKLTVIRNGKEQTIKVKLGGK